VIFSTREPLIESLTVQPLDPAGGEVFIPSIIQLTDPGCCVQPFWSADSRVVQFIDRPNETAPTAIYGIDVTTIGRPFIVSEQVGLPSPDGRWIAYLSDAGETVMLNTESGENLIIPNGGLRPYFSPDSSRIAWADTATVGNFDQRSTVISVANVDGSNAARVTAMTGGGFVGWLDNETVLLSGRTAEVSESALFIYSLLDGSRIDLVRNQRIWSASISPGGEWIQYTVALSQTADAAAEGMWVMRRDGGQAYKLEVVGSAQWRDDHRLVVIPLDIDAESHRLWQFDALTGGVTSLTAPEQTRFRVAAADWRISPDGLSVVFLNAEDNALWLITLPPLDSAS
jgi:Tol biopolymer transport system component